MELQSIKMFSFSSNKLGGIMTDKSSLDVAH